MKKLGFGLMRLPQSKNEEWGNVDLEKTQQMIDAYIEQGFSYFDTAWVYHGGFSEKIFGELVAKRYPREKFQVTSKMPVWELKSENDLDRIFEEQLKKCNIEYFDYYFLHALGGKNIDFAEKFNGFNFLQKKKAEGKIKHIGFSFHDTAEKLDELLTNHPEVELVQLQINYIDWESDTVQSRKCFEVALKHNKQIAIMEPIKGGSLVNIMDDAKKIFTDFNPNASLASWAIRYASSLKNVLIVLSGMSNMEQLNDNMSYMKNFIPLSKDEYNVISKATELIKKTIAVPCTACHYCTDGCPQKINIPRYFELFNDSKRYGIESYKWNYNDEKNKGGSPSDCISCHLCESNCPQKIEIVSMLKAVAEAFEG